MLFDRDNPTNTILQIEVIFDIGSIIYIYIISLRLNNLVLIFDIGSTISSYYNCKNERCKLFIISFLVYHLIKSNSS